MENEKFQELVVQQLNLLTEGQQSLLKEQKLLSDNHQSLLEGQKALSEELRDIQQNQVRMEQELTEKVRALFDAREVQNDINQTIINSLNRIEAKVDVLQMETAYLGRVK